MSLSEASIENLERQELLLKRYLAKALDSTNEPMSIMQSMMFAQFHQQQMILILLAAIDDKLDRLESVQEDLSKLREVTRNF